MTAAGAPQQPQPQLRAMRLRARDPVVGAAAEAAAVRPHSGAAEAAGSEPHSLVDLGLDEEMLISTVDCSFVAVVVVDYADAARPALYSVAEAVEAVDY